MRIVSTVPASWPSPSPGRFAAQVRTASAERSRLALLGLPDDLGVRLNFGRPGAASGAVAFRGALASFGASFDAARAGELETLLFDAGDVAPAAGDDVAALFETHARVEAAVSELHALGLVVA